ncbi:MAG: ATPase, T2SS/T4P/T4SS family [Promethearchaeota archaeon]
MDSETRLIRCPVGRCEKCSERTETGCHRLKDSGIRPVLIEVERGFLHLWENENLQQLHPSYPPWHMEGWETVFTGVDSSLFDDFDNILEVYKVGPYLNLFKRFGERTMYCSIPVVRTSLEKSLVEELSDRTKFDTQSVSINSGISRRFEMLTDVVSKHILNFIPEISETTRNTLSTIIAQRRSILGPLIPIILDDLVEELYLDCPRTPVYFDHQKLGRCDATFSFHEDDVPKIITLIRSESNLHLDRSNPSLKMDMHLLGSSLRVSVSIPPLSPDGLHLEIRRARNKPFTMVDLIENGTITPDVAAILLLAITCRFNITITGGPGTGKTTLMNAMDLATPRWWRKIYIEDTVESRNQETHHQVRFKVDPVDERLGRFDKSGEIIKCLHRSPDYLILGEIQTAEHSRALFQAIVAGLRTIQTCHSDSSSSLVSRWKQGHGIEDSILAMMDMIVTLERPIPGKSNRRVKEIAEIRKSKDNGLLLFSGLNVVYDARKGYSDWAQDGAFLTFARSLGIESHEPALCSLKKMISANMCQSNFETLSEQLWSNDNPLGWVQ